MAKVLKHIVSPTGCVHACVEEESRGRRTACNHWDCRETNNGFYLRWPQTEKPVTCKRCIDLTSDKSMFTVIGYYADTDQRFSEYVQALSGDDAEEKILTEYKQCSLVVVGVIKGMHTLEDSSPYVSYES